MWTVGIIMIVLTIYEVGVSDALSTGYLVLGSNGEYVNKSFQLLSIPIQTENGNTTFDLNRNQTVSYTHYLTRPESIYVDYGRKQVYIYDRHTATLQKLNFDPESSNPNLTFTYLHSGLSRGEVKIALDWISNNLYWTDPTFRSVTVQSLRNDGNYKIIVFDNVEKPTGIAVDPIHQYLFWSDVGSLPKIERSTLTGSSRKIIVSQGIAYPIALDVDIQSSKLYWVDSYRNSVERSNLDGTEREMIKRLVLSTFLDIQVFSDVILTTEINLSGFVRLFNKETGKNDTLVGSAERDYHIISVTLYAPKPTTTDHCASSPCENICVSESTRPVCLCAEGFALNSDGRTCSATTGSLHRALVWATTTTLCAADIRGIHNEREYITSNKTCFSNVGSNINWITVDSHDRKIIFADGSDIFAMTLDGVHTKKRITSATETVTGLAVDWGDKNVYWCQGQQSGTGKINVFSQTTTNIQTLISSGLDNPKALNMIPLLSTMIWINGRLGSYQIKKAHVHGTDIQTIVSFMDLFEPRDLTVDAASQRLYFIDGNSFKSVQLDGSELTEVYVWVAYTIRPLKLHSYKNNLLVADDGFNIDVVPLTGTGSASLRTLVSVTDICVVDINEQPKENGPCDANNGKCEHICIPLGQNRICQCSYGFVLDSNKETCSSEPLSDNFMYISDWTHNKLYQVSLINDAVNALDSSTVDAPTGVLYNSITNRIYWGDTTTNYIQSANVNGAGYSVLIDVGVYRAHPDRLALDYSTGNIYYTAVKTSQLPASFTGIGVVSPNGHHRKLISGGVYPRAVEIDPSKGYLFWTDYGTTPAVLKRAHTDGTKIVTLFTSMKWPNGIAIDRSASALYVTDGYTNIIYRCGYEVNTCDQYFKDPESHLMDIKLLGNYLYYTAWNKVYITKLHKTNSSDIAKFANNAELGRLDSISLYSSTFLPTNIQSQCSSNNGRGNCSTFCHPTPNSFTCGCPDGEQVHLDGKTCRSVSCPMREMQEDRKVFTFSATRIGERGYSWERCYPYNKALATADCNGTNETGAFWENTLLAPACGTVPDYNQSSSTSSLKGLAMTKMDEHNYIDILRNTVNLTSPDVNVTEADVIYTADILSNLYDANLKSTDTVLSSVYKITNNILFADRAAINNSQKITNAANRIVKSVDDLTNRIQLPGLIDRDNESASFVEDYIASEVWLQNGDGRVVIGISVDNDSDRKIKPGSVTSLAEDSELRFNKTEVAIYLTKNLLKGNLTKLSFHVYSRWNLFSDSSNRYVVQSSVAAARLTRNNREVRDLGNEFVTAMFHLSKTPANLVCAYWDYNANEAAGGWETDGCNLTHDDNYDDDVGDDDGDTIVCKCNHLTNFAVLVDLNANSQLSETDKVVLSIITKVGLILSIIGFGLTILTFLMFKHLRNGRGQHALVNLSAAMLCSAILFLVGMDRTSSYGGCIAVAVLLHYFILVSFMWMLVEGVLQYLRFVKVLGTYIPNFMMKSMIPAWGIPLIPVIVILAVDYDMYYGGKGYCWLSRDPMLYGFIIPVAVIILSNLIVFTMVMCKLFRRKNKHLASNQSDRKMAFLHFQAAVSIFFILGLTWVFGFLTVDDTRIAFHYLFAIFNAFQGLCVFLLFTARVKQPLKAWKKR
ncbi:hypothetical protein DPMN_176154, partial [Dreissena polymorpha]